MPDLRAIAAALSILSLPIVAHAEEPRRLVTELQLSIGAAGRRLEYADNPPCYCKLDQRNWSPAYGVTWSVGYRPIGPIRVGLMGQWDRQTFRTTSASDLELSNNFDQFEVGPLLGVDLDLGAVGLLLDLASGYARSSGIPPSILAAKIPQAGLFFMLAVGVRYFSSDALALTGRAGWLYRRYSKQDIPVSRLGGAPNIPAETAPVYRVSIGVELNLL